VDNNHKTYRDFIEDYIFKWRPNEVKYGQEWRVDKPITVRLADGTTAVKKPNTHTAWYNVRRPLYKFFEVSFAEGLTGGLSIEDTIQLGEQIYRTIKSDKQDRPALQDVKQRFVTALQNMGIWGERACVGACSSILRDAVTDALEILYHGDDTLIDEDTELQDDAIHETTEEIDVHH
jgi:hypothetical protein